MAEYFIEFDGRTITVQTNDERIASFVEGTYRHMLVGAPRQPGGLIRIESSGSRYVVQGFCSVELEGDDPNPLFPLLKEELGLQFIRERPDLLWLHAGAAERNGHALVICGPSGRGKSTLATLLSEGEWRLMSDDLLAVRMDDDLVLPFCQRPSRRIFPGQQVSELAVSSLEREAVDFGPERLMKLPARILAFVFPRFVPHEAVDLRQLTPGDAAMEILRNARNLVDHKAAAAERVASIVRRIPAFSLTYSSSSDAAAVLNAI